MERGVESGLSILPDVREPVNRKKVAPLRDVVVRQILSDEWKPYSELRLRALKSDPLAFGSTYEREQAFPAEKWRKLTRTSTDPPRSATWVAVDRTQKFVGIVVVAEIDSTLHVFAMWVEPHLRKKGLGGRLLDAALAWSDEWCTGRPLVLEVNPRQVGAVRLYESRGFRATGKASPLVHTPGEQVVEMVRSPVAQESKPR